MIPIETAYELIDQNVLRLPDESVSLIESAGRFLAMDVNADIDSPPHDKSVMDGFAVQSRDINGGIKRLKVTETIIAGDWPKSPIQSGEAARIMTGAPLPEGADSVVMVELSSVEQVDETEWVTLNVESIQPEKHILRCGTNF